MLFGKSGVVRSGLGQEKYGKLSILIFSHNLGAIPPISLSLSRRLFAGQYQQM